MTIQAIETHWAGCRFRSRLEARWAVFFETLGLHWEYEPEGFETSAGWYLPDFLIRTKFYCDRGKGFSVYAEVKPELNSDWSKAAALAKYKSVACLVGMPGDYQGAIPFLLPSPSRSISIATGTFSSVGIIPTGGVERYTGSLIIKNDPGLTRAEIQSIQPAVIAARSARFEHGQAPAYRGGL